MFIFPCFVYKCLTDCCLLLPCEHLQHFFLKMWLTEMHCKGTVYRKFIYVQQCQIYF